MHITPYARPEDRPRAARSRPHWVIAELDARGEIDGHAAMCLRHGIGAALDSEIEAIVVDLRDLSAIDPEGLALFVRARAGCQARGIHLELLLSGRESHVSIARAFSSVGLGDRLDFTAEPAPPARTAPRLVS